MLGAVCWRVTALLRKLSKFSWSFHFNRQISLVCLSKSLAVKEVVFSFQPNFIKIKSFHLSKKISFHNYLSMIIEAVWWHTSVDTVFQPFTVGCFIGRPIFHFCRLYRNFGGKAGTHFVCYYHDQIGVGN